MSLRSKILIIMLAVVALFSAVFYAVQHFVIMPSFDVLEREQVKKDIRQCVDIIKYETRYIDRLCSDWAGSEELLRSFQSGKVIMDTALSKDMFERGKLDHISVLDVDGEVLWSRTLGVSGKPGREVSPFREGEKDKRKFLLKCRDAREYVFGIVTTDRLPMLVSCRPVSGGRNSSEAKGILVAGRFLTKRMTDALASQVRINFDLWSMDISTMPIDAKDALRKIERGNDYVVSIRGRGDISGYAVLTDVRGNSAVLLRARMPRFVGLTGQAAVRTAQLAVIASAFLLLVVMILALQELVISPVEKLTDHVVKFADEQQPADRPKRGNNEIKTLMQEFSLMVEQIRKHEEQMIQAHKMIALGTLVSGVAHEISNPNGVITLNAAMIGKLSERMFEALDQRAKEDADFKVGGKPYEEARAELESLTLDVAKSAERIKTIVSDLTDFVRQDTTDLSEVLDINAVVKDTLGLVSSTINKATENVAVSYGEDIPYVKGNSNRLQQVFINLISNACHALKAPGQGGIRIKTKFLKDKSEVCVTVEDDGEGISEENLLRIKDPFFTTRRDEGGTGLGLAICDGIVVAHGGTMLFESKEGKGTTVTVRLPVNDE